MNTYSLRSKKYRQSSTTIIGLSLDSDDDDEGDDERSSDTVEQHGMIPQEDKDTLSDVSSHAADGDGSVRDHVNSQLQTTLDTPSIISCTSNITEEDVCPLFDEAEYTTLRQRYLEPRIRNKPELPDGMILRRQYRGRIIDTNTPLYRKLRVKVDALLKKNNHEEVYQVLCQLRDWELDPRRVPEIFQIEADEDILEIVDLTDSSDEPPCIDCIDVDQGITTNATSTIMSSSIPEVVQSSSPPASQLFMTMKTQLSRVVEDGWGTGHRNLSSDHDESIAVGSPRIASRVSSSILELKISATFLY